jgi:hypothetical protein
MKNFKDFVDKEQINEEVLNDFGRYVDSIYLKFTDELNKSYTDSIVSSIKSKFNVKSYENVKIPSIRGVTSFISKGWKFQLEEGETILVQTNSTGRKLLFSIDGVEESVAKANMKTFMASLSKNLTDQRKV